MFLYLSLLLQDGAVDDLIRRLGADDVAAREEAQEAILKLGEPARAAVEAALKSDNPEISARAKTLLERLDLEKLLREALGERRTYEIKADDEPLDAVLRRFAETHKLTLSLSVDADARVTIDATAANPHEIIDRICAASGKAVFDPRKMAVTSGPFSLRSAFNDRWGFSVLSFKRPTSQRGVAAVSSAQFFAAWDTAKTPASGAVDFESIVTDAGQSLLLGEDMTDGTLHPRGPSTSTTLHFADPDAAARSVTLKGTATFVYDIDEGVIAVDPALNDRLDTPLGSLKIAKFKRDGDSVTANLTFNVDGLPAGSDLARRMNLVTRAVDADGKTYDASCTGSSRVSSGNRLMSWGYNIKLTVPAGKTIDRFEVVYPKRTHAVRVPFEFKDVPIN